MLFSRNPNAVAGLLVMLTSIIHGRPVAGRTWRQRRFVDLDSMMRPISGLAPLSAEIPGRRLRPVNRAFIRPGGSRPLGRDRLPGPAYPRGYKNIGVNAREPFEVRDVSPSDDPLRDGI